MESTTDIDLEELESRLYSQVFHSTENWDSPSNTQNPISTNNVQTRHVSAYTVSNITVSGKRYWDAKNSHDSQNIQQNIENIDNTITQSTEHQSKPTDTELPHDEYSFNKNSPALDSIIPLETTQTTAVLEYRTKPLKYKSYDIPTTFKLPKSRVKSLPNYIVNYFNLNSKACRQRFRMFLRYVEKSQKNNNTEKILKNIDAENRTEKSPPEITITCNGIDRSIKLSDIPIPEKNDSDSILKEAEIKRRDDEIITLSDSDSDSVIEIPLPPIPTYNVDTSSESEVEDETCSNKVTGSPENNIINGIVDANEYENEETPQQSLANQIHKENETNSKNQPVDNVDMNASFTELEKERDDFLHTPDTNDFLEHDNTLNKTNLSFNFGLHSSDLDLSKEKEDMNPKSNLSANYNDLYETESSCSEIGSVISKARPIFNEINFESPIKDIFCEPDLTKFSNFITPNRDTQTSSKKGKVRSNTVFVPIQTKSCSQNINEGEEEVENIRRSRSDSSEYHSDPMTLKVKKKKKPKRKLKKKGKLLDNSEVCPSPTEEMQTEEYESEVVPVPQSSKSDISPATIENKKTQSKSPSPSKQIENLKSGTSSNKSTEKIQKSPEKFANSTSPSTNQKPCTSVTDYYEDTYFADDCLLLEELEKQKQEIGTEISGEIQNEIDNSTKNTIFEDTNLKEKIINTDTASTLINDAQSSKTKTSDNGVQFSFVETWRKSTDKNCNVSDSNTEEGITPTKKLKIDKPTTFHPYVVTLVSSDDESSKSSEISVRSNPQNVIVDVTDDISCPDLILINVENNKANSSPKNNMVANPFSFVETYQQNKDKKSFKDFWTNDMTKFYEESWGQENYDLDKAQSSMSGNASDWKVLPDDIVRYSQRRKGPLCLRCREFGHTQHNCTRFSGPIKCSTCGTAGHAYTRCPNSICTTCRNPSTHLTMQCGKCAHFSTVLCNLCNNVGHEMTNCPDLWRRYHLTTESHTELKASSSVLKSPSERWCSNCAQRGHCEDKCTYLRQAHFPTTPGIISYVPTYDEVFKLPVATPAPNIPIFKDANVTITDLKILKRDIIQSSNQKYLNILKKLRQQCNKYDYAVINRIDRLRRNMQHEVFNKKKIQEINKLRAQVARNNL